MEGFSTVLTRILEPSLPRTLRRLLEPPRGDTLGFFKVPSSLAPRTSQERCTLGVRESVLALYHMNAYRMRTTCCCDLRSGIQFESSHSDAMIPKTKTDTTEAKQKQYNITSLIESYIIKCTVVMSSSNRTSPQARDKDKGNAFSVLMSNKKRKSVSYSGGAMLVNCPVCSKTMPNIRLNAHLDVCIQAGNMEGNVVVASPVPVGLEKRFDENEDKDKANEYHTQSAQVSQTQSAEKNINCIKIDMDEIDVDPCHLIENQNAFLDEVICDEGDDANKVLVSSSSNQIQGGSLTVKKQKKNIENDAFSRMMKQSVAVFSTPSLPRKQNFHLHSNFTVSWEEYDGPGTFASLNLNKWSSSIMIKKEPIEKDSAEADNDSKAFNAGPSKCQYQDLELYVTSSVASASGMPRLVCRQSRLSVPTLKSILQKAIRRKLPVSCFSIYMEFNSII